MNEDTRHVPSRPYDFKLEAKVVCEAIGSDNGNCTVRSALYEAFDAGGEGYRLAFRQAEDREIQALQLAQVLRDALRLYVEWCGPVHVDGCPADDTCFCSGSAVNDAVNSALKASDAFNISNAKEESGALADGGANSHVLPSVSAAGDDEWTDADEEYFRSGTRYPGQ